MGHSLGVRTRAIKTLAPRTLTWEWICATPGRSPKGHSGVDDSTAAEGCEEAVILTKAATSGDINDLDVRGDLHVNHTAGAELTMACHRLQVVAQDRPSVLIGTRVRRPSDTQRYRSGDERMSTPARVCAPGTVVDRGTMSVEGELARLRAENARLRRLLDPVGLTGIVTRHVVGDALDQTI